MFDRMGDVVSGSGHGGSARVFVFGEAFRDHFIVFKVLPTIIFFSSFITVLYYLGVMQRWCRCSPG
jgi:CNT family concentrative nucleoside transporter